MKWMRLKVYLLPAIMQEVDSVTETYINMINDLRRNNNRQTLSEFMELREDISNRIEEIDNFYEDNIGDSRVVNFEKARIRLKKLLMYDPDLMNRMDQQNDEADFRGLSFGYNNEIVANKTPNKTRNNGDANPLTAEKVDRTNNIAMKQKSETKPKINNSSGHVTNQVNQMTHMTNQSFNTARKMQDTKVELNLDELIGSSVNRNTNMMNITNMTQTMNNENDWKEIIFKIKLTEPEYKLLLKEKAKLFNVK